MASNLSNPAPVFVNKILLKMMTHVHLSIVCECFCTKMVELSSCERDHMRHHSQVCVLCS